MSKIWDGIGKQFTLKTDKRGRKPSKTKFKPVSYATKQKAQAAKNKHNKGKFATQAVIRKTKSGYTLYFHKRPEGKKTSSRQANRKKAKPKTIKVKVGGGLSQDRRIKMLRADYKRRSNFVAQQKTPREFKAWRSIEWANLQKRIEKIRKGGG